MEGELQQPGGEGNGEKRGKGITKQGGGGLRARRRRRMRRRNLREGGAQQRLVEGLHRRPKRTNEERSGSEVGGWGHRRKGLHKWKMGQ
eukprot:756578-Hanusia_phi.AAC.2